MSCLGHRHACVISTRCGGDVTTRPAAQAPTIQCCPYVANWTACVVAMGSASPTCPFRCKRRQPCRVAAACVVYWAMPWRKLAWPFRKGLNRRAFTTNYCSYLVPDQRSACRSCIPLRPTTRATGGPWLLEAGNRSRGVHFTTMHFTFAAGRNFRAWQESERTAQVPRRSAVYRPHKDTVRCGE